MKFVHYFILLVLFQSCNLAKRLPSNERLYVGTDINLLADSTITKDDKANLEDQLGDLARPRPAQTLLGVPY